MILDNPFHVLGLPADCTTKELNRRKAQAEAYLRIGKPLEFDEDLYISRHCHRNSSTVGRAIKQLHDGRERMQHGLFWFTRGGPLDAHALRLLARGKTRDAYEALTRIGSRPVDAAAAPSLNNLGTLCLLLGLDPPSGETGAGGSELRGERITYGLRAKARLVGQLPEPELVRLCASLGDELAARDSEAVVEAFREAIKRAIEEAKRYGVSVSGQELVEALDAGGPRLAPIKAELGSAAREEIERAIKACEASRRRDASGANDAARALRAVLKVQLPALARAISTDDYLYRSLADAGAEALVNTTTVYFNDRVENDELSLDVILELLPIGEYAAEIACGEAAVERAHNDVATLRRMESNERQRTRFGPAFTAMGAWFAMCDALGEDEDALPSKLETFVVYSLNPNGPPTSSVIATLGTLNAADSPLADPAGGEDCEAVAMNSSVCHRLLALTIQAYNTSDGRLGGERILTRLSAVFCSVNEAGGRRVRFPVSDDCVRRLRENLQIVRHNREVAERAAEAVASRSGCAGVFAALLLVLLVGILLIPGIAGAEVQRPNGEAPPNTVQEARGESRRRLEELEAATAAMSERVETLEAGRERDARRIRRLEAALEEAEAARREIAERADAHNREQVERDAEVKRDITSIRTAANDDRARFEAALEAAETVRRDIAERADARNREQDERNAAIQRDIGSIRSAADDDQALLADEVMHRSAGDRRTAGYTLGALALAGLAVGFLWRWSRRRTDGLGKRFDRSWSSVQQLLGEAGEQSAKALVALEELVSREPPAAANAEPDHKLVLLMCNEINRMENNLRHMDSAARGHKKLLGVVRRMKENLGTRGYEITLLHGQRYVPGLTVVAEDWITDEGLAPGRDVISWVKTPEVRFRGEIVQSARVQIARNE